jgi:hypothetical protein
VHWIPLYDALPDARCDAPSGATFTTRGVS